MLKTCKSVRVQWSTESLKFAASATNSGNPLAAACKIFGIPHRTLHDWISRKGSPLKKLGRNAILPVDAEKQLHQKK
jgi:hypothetical protein